VFCSGTILVVVPAAGAYAKSIIFPASPGWNIPVAEKTLNESQYHRV